jgi:hypothetical protein
MKPSPAAIDAIKQSVEDNSIANHIEEYDGICFVCGEWKYGECEPDARNYRCDECGRRAVYGAEESLFYILT